MKKIKDTDTEVVYKCPYCGTGQIRIEKNGAHKYGYCDICDAAYIHYIPLLNQTLVLWRLLITHCLYLTVRLLF